jgi:GR25 family glycosyltransferase involved in LPS biosynthesis
MGAKQSKYGNDCIIVSPNAGLGNQLFQIANGYAYALNNNKKLYIHCIWNGMSKSRPSYWRTYLKNLNSYLIHPRETKKIKKYKESTFGYSSIPKFSKSIVLEGYYQSEKYFEDYKEEIKSLFQLPEELKPTIQNFKNGICVAIHVRRGDYLKHKDFHIIMSKDYYKKSKQIIEEKLGVIPNYYYFSDDIEYTKQMFKDETKESDKFVSGYKDYEELYLMSLCDHFIIANSTFSWWASYLSSTQSEENKIIIAPNPWFGAKGPQDFHSIYCKNWIQVDSLGKDIIVEKIVSNSVIINQDEIKIQLEISPTMELTLKNSKTTNGIFFHNEENDTSLAFSYSGNIYTSKNDTIYYDSYNRNSNINIDKSSIIEIQKQAIVSKIVKSENKNSFDIYIINLKHRNDRKKEIISSLKDSSIFNLHFFEAIKFNKGWIGCGLSHLYLIRYAQMMNLPYIIVAEDDFQFKLSNEKIKEALALLTSNLDEWEVFNGSPSFWDKRNDISSLEFIEPVNPELKSLFVKANWGQSTSFMIYNTKAYSKLLKYPFIQEIDQYIAKNFLQIVYKPEPFSIQKASYSDVSNRKQTKDYEDFFLSQCKIIQNTKTIEKELTVGVQVIFVDKYETFYEQFISNCEERFLPQYKKYYYIVTDNKNLPKYNDRTFIYYTERIGWPYETLYRFKYFLEFKQEEIDKSDYIYFINSNGKFLETIDKEVLPDSSGYSFTTHHGFYQKKYSDLAYEKNSKSTAYIPFDKSKTYKYFAGGFYGAKKDKFMELCKTLDEKITEDEKNNYIAVWHDESHINKFCFDLNYNFKQLGIDYHIPEEKLKSFHIKKLIYLDKKKYIPQTDTVKDLKHGHKNTNGKIILNKYNYTLKISILMPIYNGIEYIEESISSIKSQTYTNWELLIGINGYPENSEIYRKAKTYESEKIKVYDFFTLKGKSVSLNELVKHTSSELVTLLDVDDIWYPEKLRTQVMKTLDYDIVGTKCVYFGDKEGIIPEIPSGDLSSFDFKIVNPIINSSCLLKKELCFWNQEYDGIEDYELWLKLKSQNKKFYNLEEVLVKHRIHRDSAFNTKKFDIEGLKNKY